MRRRYILLGRASGVSNILMWLGVMDEAGAYQPSFAAVLLGLCYIAFPYCVLTMYPQLTRLDPEITEAAPWIRPPRGRADPRCRPTHDVPHGDTTLLIPSMIAGYAAAFVLSLNEYIISFLVAGFTVETLPVKIVNGLRYGFTPTIAAVAVVFILIAASTLTLFAIFGNLMKYQGADPAILEKNKAV